SRGRLEIAPEIRGWNREERERPEQFPGEMSGPPKLERANRCNENVKDQCRWSNHRGGESKQGHGRDVTGGAGVSDRGGEEGDHRDRQAKKNEGRCVHLD